MEIKIGVQSVPREIVVYNDQSREDVERVVSAALTGDAGDLLSFTDSSGRRVLVPADKLAYVEFSEREQQQVGFGAYT